MLCRTSFPRVAILEANFTTARCRRYQFTPEIFGRLTNPYPRWIKQGTSGGPDTYEGENYPAWNYQPLTRRGARPRTRPNHPRERVTASVRAHDYHGKRAQPQAGETCFTIERVCRNLTDLSLRVRGEFFIPVVAIRETCERSISMNLVGNPNRSTLFSINFLTSVSEHTINFLHPNFPYVLFYGIYQRISEHARRWSNTGAINKLDLMNAMWKGQKGRVARNDLAEKHDEGGGGMLKVL